MDPEIKSALFRVLPFAFVLVIFFVTIKSGKNNPLALGLVKPNSKFSFILWLTGYWIFVLLAEIILYKLDILEIQPWDHPLLSSVLRILGAVILAPISEELIFRGLLLNKLISLKIDKYLAIFLQAALFVLLHNFTYENTLGSNLGIVQSFIDASLFGFARYYTRSLYTPIAMHISGNLVATLERFIL